MRSVAIAFAVLVAGWLSVPAAQADEQQRLFRFVQVTDSHVTTSEARKASGKRRIDIAMDILERAVLFIKETIHPDWIVSTGDTIENGAAPCAEADLTRVKRILDSAGVPAFVLFGNHENNLARFENLFGRQDYAFTCRGVRCVMLNSGMVPESRKPQGYRAVEKVLMQHPDRPTLVFQHLQIFTGVSLIQKSFPDSKEMLEVLDRHPQVSACFTGHLHLRWVARRNGVTYVTGPALCEPLFSFMVYDVYPKEIRAHVYVTRTTGPVATWHWDEQAEQGFTVPFSREAQPGPTENDYQRELIPRD